MIFLDSSAIVKLVEARDQLKALWLHRAVAGHLVADPHAVLTRAATNLDRLRAVHPTGMTARWLEQWRVVLAGGAESALDALTSRSAHTVELRQNSPFAGVLSESERHAVLTAFATYWRDAHAAPTANKLI